MEICVLLRSLSTARPDFVQTQWIVVVLHVSTVDLVLYFFDWNQWLMWRLRYVICDSRSARKWTKNRAAARFELPQRLFIRRSSASSSFVVGRLCVAMGWLFVARGQFFVVLLVCRRLVDTWEQRRQFAWTKWPPHSKRLFSSQQKCTARFCLLPRRTTAINHASSTPLRWWQLAASLLVCDDELNKLR